MKTPTIKELRVLAKQKGLDIEQIPRLGRGRPDTELWWAGELTHFASFFDTLKNKTVRLAVAGALRALPDEKVAR